jgi:hypothetical protein
MWNSTLVPIEILKVGGHLSIESVCEFGFFGRKVRAFADVLIEVVEEGLAGVYVLEEFH